MRKRSFNATYPSAALSNAASEGEGGNYGFIHRVPGANQKSERARERERERERDSANGARYRGTASVARREFPKAAADFYEP